jgi:hypothetical protein
VFHPPLRPLHFSLLLSWIALGCGGGAEFQVQYAPGATRQGAHISVFGIKRDGLMSRAGWDALSPELSAPFGAKRCAVAYSDELFGTKAELAEAIERYVRENGVTDVLLDELAPAAQGDTILLVTSAGRPRTAGSDAAGPEVAAPRGRGMSGGRRGAATRGVRPDTDKPSADYQLTALFFGVREHKTVAVVEMNYTGTSGEEAIAEFRNRLESEFSGASCAGWNFSVEIDPLKIRKLASE